MSPAPKSEPNFDFGKNLDELEAIVARLERGDLDLNAAMAQFERGAALAARLQKYLDRAQLKVNSIKASFDKPDPNLVTEDDAE